MAYDFPNSPTDGQIFTASTGTVYYWSAAKNAWRAQPSSLAPAVVSDAPPSNAVSGTLWYNSSDGNLYVYYVDSDSSQWVQIRTDMSFTSTIGPSVDSLNLRSPNYIINGAFEINQRAFSSTTSSGYTFDRWNVASSNGTVTFSAQTFTPGTEPSTAVNTRSFLRCVTTGQTLTSAYAIFGQPIEGVETLAGQTVTVSFWAKAATGTPKVALEFYRSYGTGGSPSADDQTYGGQVTLSTTLTRYSLTVTLPSLSGKTIGTTTDGYIKPQFWVSAGSDFNARTGSLGIQSNTFDFWGFQVEAGAQASTFRRNANSLQGELAACQRYCYQLWSGSTDFEMIVTRTSATVATGTVFLPVPMRTIPFLTATSSGGFYGRLVGRDTSFGLTTVGVTGIEAKSALPGTNALANANNSQIDIWFTHSTLAGTYVFVNFDTYSYSSPAWLTAEL